MAGSGGEAEDRERARIRRLLRERGIPDWRITGKLIDFWIVQDARDREEGRRIGHRRPSGLFLGGGW